MRRSHGLSDQAAGGMFLMMLMQKAMLEVVVVVVVAGGGLAASEFYPIAPEDEITVLQDTYEPRVGLPSKIKGTGGPLGGRDTPQIMNADLLYSSSSIGDLDLSFNEVVTSRSSVSTPPAHDSLANWTRLKGIFTNMKSILTKINEAGTEPGHVPISVLDQILKVEDYFVMAEIFYNSLDPELHEHFKQLYDRFMQFLFRNPLLRTIQLPDMRAIKEELFPLLLIKVGHLFHQQAITFVHEVDFVFEMMKSSGFKNEEIYLIFELLGLSSMLEEEEHPVKTWTAKSKQARDISDQFSSNIGFRRDSHGGYGYSDGGYGYPDGGYGYSDGGYGHSDGYGGSGSPSGYGGGYHSGGYGGYGGYMQYMPKVDPFVILAGLTFLTLCSYLTYLVVSSKTSKRSLSEFPHSLDLSDLPDLLALVEDAHNFYSYDALNQDPDDPTQSLSLAFNNLWRSYKRGPESGICVRRFLCQQLHNLPYLLGPEMSFMQLSVSSLAQTLGVTEAARTADQINKNKWLRGISNCYASCSILPNTPECPCPQSVTSREEEEDGVYVHRKRTRVTAEPK
ncbi:uncharacterized protein LOC121873178 isoform X2 [Homarus americanus]|uniref:uncharacterized protein LOC121873178 isoform X2 n=1 Tax=Homarus americanus TaxID=6706 RepID=UPI001C4380FA|nr:uncharacterized protein LOC121873178 isoform X2 [Homarus americanus]